ncbi:hypothetical protein [uncultured Cohaesibacter sp.]|uniref:hypothetical protein n=1 Tax=uncultured Cohaesibacter sp. TaxID=1002546 RepID=UPI0029309145|nr:hypothetical protein [uncultured Cohaesibacter sp.]
MADLVEVDEKPSVVFNSNIFINFVVKCEFDGVEKENVILENVKKYFAKMDDSLFEKHLSPFSSFIDDITLANHKVSTCPVVLKCEDYSENYRHDVRVSFPQSILYKAEDRNVLLKSRCQDGWNGEFHFVDLFAVFESGNIYYILSIFPKEDELDKLSEYEIIQLMKIQSNTEGLRNSENGVKFSCSGGTDLNFIEFVNNRLKSFCNRSYPLYNFLKEIYDVDINNIRFQKHNVRNLILGIEDKNIFDELRKYHDCRECSSKFEYFKAISGMVQGIIDFQYQDEHEISDSLEPSCPVESEYQIITKNAFFVFSADWRTFKETKFQIGTCPYLFLPAMICINNEDVVNQTEDIIQEIIHGSNVNKRTSEPFLELNKTVKNRLNNPVKLSKKIVIPNILRKTKAFHLLNVDYVENIFRYKNEINLYNSAHDVRKISYRRDYYQKFLDGHSELIKEINDIGLIFDNNKINRILLFIAILSIISIVTDGYGLVGSILKVLQ